MKIRFMSLGKTSTGENGSMLPCSIGVVNPHFHVEAARHE